jgi:predicted MFS family arabinose efflux permease
MSGSKLRLPASVAPSPPIRVRGRLRRSVSSPQVDGTRRSALAVVATGNFAQLGARFLLSPMVPLVIVAFDASTSTLGLALTGMWATYALFQFPSGVLADRYGERRLLVTGLLGTVVGTALVALSPTLYAFAGFAIVLGAGTGLFFSPASSLLSRLFEARGGALGALTAAGALAGVVYPAVGGFVGVEFGWRVAVGLGAVVAVPVLVGSAWLLPSPEPANPDRRLRAAADPRRLFGLLSRPHLAFTTLIAVLVSFTFQAFSSLFPTFLLEFRGVAPGFTGVVFGAVFGLSTLAQPVVGWLSDAVSRDAAIGTSVSLAATGFVVLLTVPGRVGLVAGSTVLGLGISWPGAIQARFMDGLDDAERGYGFGLVRTTYMLLAAPGSAVVGTLADAAGWLVAFGSVVAVLLTALVALAAANVLSLDL